MKMSFPMNVSVNGSSQKLKKSSELPKNGTMMYGLYLSRMLKLELSILLTLIGKTEMLANSKKLEMT